MAIHWAQNVESTLYQRRFYAMTLSRYSFILIQRFVPARQELIHSNFTARPPDTKPEINDLFSNASPVTIASH